MEKTCVALIVLIFLCPLLLTLVTFNLEKAPAWAQWLNSDLLCNRTLRGIRIEPPVVDFSWLALRRASYQTSISSRFDVHFAGRELLIRLTNELIYRLFRTSTVRTDRLVLGQDDWLFEKVYLEEYSFRRYAASDLEPAVDTLRRFQEECRKRGIPFIILITPSKASAESEKVPSIWKQRYDPRPRSYPVFKKLLDENHLPYVDGVELTAKARQNAIVPVFPRGGIHWTEYGTLPAANALHAFFREKGLNLQALEIHVLDISENPQGDDADIYSIMNLFVPWHYKVGKLLVKEVPAETSHPNLVVIGDSFMWQLVRKMSESKQWGEIAAYFYNKVRKTTYIGGRVARVTEHQSSMDFDREVLAADAVIYEVNEGNIGPNDSRVTLLAEILAHADHSPPKKVAFLSERARPYWWGEKITFHAFDDNIRAGFLDGFLDPQPPLIWTTGPEAKIELAGATPVRDLVLAAEISSNIAKQDPASIVDVSANGQPVGQWSITAAKGKEHRVTIPRRLVPDGKLVVALQISSGDQQRATAPTLSISSVEVFQTSESTERSILPDAFMAYQLGQKLSFQAGAPNVVPARFLHGFWPNEKHGTWTSESEVGIRLRLSPSDQDLVLSAYLGGFFPKDEKEQLVAIYANGKRIGQWSLTYTLPTKRKVTIPRTCIEKSGQLDLQFQIAYPVSPAETGLSPDPRKLGLVFTELKIESAGWR